MTLTFHCPRCQIQSLWAGQNAHMLKASVVTVQSGILYKRQGGLLYSILWQIFPLRLRTVCTPPSWWRFLGSHAACGHYLGLRNAFTSTAWQMRGRLRTPPLRHTPLDEDYTRPPMINGGSTLACFISPIHTVLQSWRLGLAAGQAAVKAALLKSDSYRSRPQRRLSLQSVRQGQKTRATLWVCGDE